MNNASHHNCTEFAHFALRPAERRLRRSRERRRRRIAPLPRIAAGEHKRKRLWLWLWLRLSWWADGFPRLGSIDVDLARVAVAKVDLDDSAGRSRFEVAPLATTVRVTLAQHRRSSEGNSQVGCCAAVGT